MCSLEASPLNFLHDPARINSRDRMEKIRGASQLD